MSIKTNTLIPFFIAAESKTKYQNKIINGKMIKERHMILFLF